MFGVLSLDLMQCTWSKQVQMPTLHSLIEKNYESKSCCVIPLTPIRTRSSPIQTRSSTAPVQPFTAVCRDQRTRQFSLSVSIGRAVFGMVQNLQEAIIWCCHWTEQSVQFRFSLSECRAGPCNPREVTNRHCNSGRKLLLECWKFSSINFFCSKKKSPALL